MPQISVLSKEEIDQLLKPQPKLDLSTYTNSLRELQPGEWAAMQREEGEHVRLVKRRMNAAGKQLGHRIKYREMPDGRIAFTIAPSR